MKPVSLSCSADRASLAGIAGQAEPGDRKGGELERSVVAPDAALNRAVEEAADVLWRTVRGALAGDSETNEVFQRLPENVAAGFQGQIKQSWRAAAYALTAEAQRDIVSRRLPSAVTPLTTSSSNEPTLPSPGAPPPPLERARMLTEQDSTNELASISESEQPQNPSSSSNIVVSGHSHQPLGKMPLPQNGRVKAVDWPISHNITWNLWHDATKDAGYHTVRRSSNCNMSSLPVAESIECWWCLKSTGRAFFIADADALEDVVGCDIDGTVVERLLRHALCEACAQHFATFARAELFKAAGAQAKTMLCLCQLRPRQAPGRKGLCPLGMRGWGKA